MFLQSACCSWFQCLFPPGAKCWKLSGFHIQPVCCVVLQFLDSVNWLLHVYHKRYVVNRICPLSIEKLVKHVQCNNLHINMFDVLTPSPPSSANASVLALRLVPSVVIAESDGCRSWWDSFLCSKQQGRGNISRVLPDSNPVMDSKVLLMCS